MKMITEFRDYDLAPFVGSNNEEEIKIEFKNKAKFGAMGPIGYIKVKWNIQKSTMKKQDHDVIRQSVLAQTQVKGLSSSKLAKDKNIATNIVGDVGNI